MIINMSTKHCRKNFIHKFHDTKQFLSLDNGYITKRCEDIRLPGTYIPTPSLTISIQL